MEEFENLRTMAEVSIALTGFTGIVATFGERLRGDWDNLEILRLRMLLETSLAVLFISLIPLLLNSLSMEVNRIWRLGNAIQALVHLGGSILLFFRIKKLGPDEWPKEETILTAILLPISIAFIAANVAISLGYSTSKGYFVFFAGLVYLLFLSACHFVLLLIPEKKS